MPTKQILYVAGVKTPSRTRNPLGIAARRNERLVISDCLASSLSLFGSPRAYPYATHIQDIRPILSLRRYPKRSSVKLIPLKSTMSCSKPLPPFVFDSLYFLNRNQLERFSIACRALKNFIDRYLHSKPYRVFNKLEIRGGSYALINNGVQQWHPNRADYSTQQFLACQKCDIDYAYYSFAEMRPFLGPTIRVQHTIIYVAGNSNYSQEHVEEMESISYLWRDHKINVLHAGFSVIDRIIAEDFQPILNSPTILQCQHLYMYNARISFKNYKVLYAVKVIEIYYHDEEDIDVWPQFLKQTGVKPVIVLQYSSREYIEKLLDRLSKAFSSAILPNTYKIVFVHCDAPSIEFRETNNTSGETLELKKGLPIECQNIVFTQYNSYTLKRSSV